MFSGGGSNGRHTRVSSLWDSVYLLLEVEEDPSRCSGTKSVQIRFRRFQWREVMSDNQELLEEILKELKIIRQILEDGVLVQREEE